MSLVIFTNIVSLISQSGLLPIGHSPETDQIPIRIMVGIFRDGEIKDAWKPTSTLIAIRSKDSAPGGVKEGVKNKMFEDTKLQKSIYLRI